MYSIGGLSIEGSACEHNMFAKVLTCVARKLREIWVPGPRNLATKFGRPRRETLA